VFGYVPLVRLMLLLAARHSGDYGLVSVNARHGMIGDDHTTRRLSVAM
jgi:hypothetical protein